MGLVRGCEEQGGSAQARELVPLEEAPGQEVTGRRRWTAETSGVRREMPVHVYLQAGSLPLAQLSPLKKEQKRVCIHRYFLSAYDVLSQLCCAVLGSERLRVSPTLTQLVQGKATVQAVARGQQRPRTHPPHRPLVPLPPLSGAGGALWRRLLKWPQRMSRTWTFGRVMLLLNGENRQKHAEVYLEIWAECRLWGGIWKDIWPGRQVGAMLWSLNATVEGVFSPVEGGVP